ncbi:MAG: HAD family hydrolase [Rhizobiales bacterium]|nr:HAD family hydrolase [Hyphomicrobiales bacterium]
MKNSGTEIRAILFDKDGTLIDFQKSWGSILRDAALLGAHSDIALARRLMVAGGMDPDTLMTAPDTVFAAGSTTEIAEAFLREGADWPIDDLIGRLDALFVASAEHGVPVTPLRPLFERLRKAGYALGIASSDSAAAIRRLAEIENIADLVDFIAGYDSGFGSKPEPGMALAFVNSVGVPAPSIAVVGDNLHDMRMGQAAGLGLRIAVLTGTGTRDRLRPESDAVLESIAGLPAYLSQGA